MEQMGFAVFPLPKRIRTSFCGFSRVLPFLEGDHGPADTLQIPVGITTPWPQPKEQQELWVLMEDFYIQAEHPKSKVNLKRKVLFKYSNIISLFTEPMAGKITQVSQAPGPAHPIHSSPYGEALRAGVSPRRDWVCKATTSILPQPNNSTDQSQSF